MSTRRWIGSLAAAAALLATSGCYKATFYKDPATVKGEEREEWTNFYVFGLVGTQNIDVKRFCPVDQVAIVRTGSNVGTGVVSLLTIGIYTPRKVYVTCAGPAGQTARRLEIELRADGRPVSAQAFSGAQRTALAFQQVAEDTWQFEEGSGS